MAKKRKSRKLSLFSLDRRIAFLYKRHITRLSRENDNLRGLIKDYPKGIPAREVELLRAEIKKLQSEVSKSAIASNREYVVNCILDFDVRLSAIEGGIREWHRKSVPPVKPPKERYEYDRSLMDEYAA